MLISTTGLEEKKCFTLNHQKLKIFFPDFWKRNQISKYRLQYYSNFPLKKREEFYIVNILFAFTFVIWITSPFVILF